jgi:hypothetical protein
MRLALVMIFQTYFKTNRVMQDKYLIFVDRVLFFFTLLFVIIALLFLALDSITLSSLIYFLFSLPYLVLRKIFRLAYTKLFLTYFGLSILLIAIQIAISLLTAKILLVEYLSLFQLAGVLVGVYGYLISRGIGLNVAGFVIFGMLFLAYPIVYLPAYNIYAKNYWINAMVIAAHASTNSERQRVENYGKCVYDKFMARYKRVSHFPIKKDYTVKDKIDIFNCSLDIWFQIV